MLFTAFNISKDGAFVIFRYLCRFLTAKLHSTLYTTYVINTKLSSWLLHIWECNLLCFNMMFTLQGDTCVFRHVVEAKQSDRTCENWLLGRCQVPKCPLRHVEMVSNDSLFCLHCCLMLILLGGPFEIFLLNKVHNFDEL